MYGVYDNDARVHWAPSRIFGDEIQVRMATHRAMCLCLILFDHVCLMTCVPTDHRLFRADLLLPASSSLPRIREDKCHRDGKRSNSKCDQSYE